MTNIDVYTVASAPTTLFVSYDDKWYSLAGEKLTRLPFKPAHPLDHVNPTIYPETYQFLAYMFERVGRST